MKNYDEPLCAMSRGTGAPAEKFARSLIAFKKKYEQHYRKLIEADRNLDAA